MTTRRTTGPLAALATLALLAPACNGAIEGAPDRPAPPVLDVDRDPIGTIDDSAARRVRRLTAEQWNASLTVATGQAWTEYAANADALGRPDFAQVTDEGDQMSVVFEQLIGAASRATCHAAVVADRALDAADERAILGTLALDAPDDEARLANLRRLLLRFHGHEVESDDDGRITPWLALLSAPIDPVDLGTEAATDADVEALRWEAICIGLATHPDFLTY